jgi:hypothetical protein
MITESARRTNVMGIHTKRAHTGKVLNLHPLNIGNENIDGVLRKYLQESVGRRHSAI